MAYIITTKQEAFNRIETCTNGIPWSAIDFLYQHETDEEIFERIELALGNVSTVYPETKKELKLRNVPLWYAIVAEKHLGFSLLNAVIGFYNRHSVATSGLKEQGLYLLNLLCQKYGDPAVQQIMDNIEYLAESNGDIYATQEYLFECLFYADEVKYFDRIIRLLENHKGRHYIGSLVCYIGYANLTSFLPYLTDKYEKRLEFVKMSHDFFEDRDEDEDDFDFHEDDEDEEAEEDFDEDDFDDDNYFEEDIEGDDDKDEDEDEDDEYFDDDDDEEEEDSEEYDAFRYCRYGLEQDLETAINCLSGKEAPKRGSYTEYRKPWKEFYLSIQDDYTIYPKHIPIKKVGRNDPCTCGSGKKYKKCCGS